MLDAFFDLTEVLNISAKEHIINESIQVDGEVRLLDEDGGQVGIVSLDAAKEYAEDNGLDLVLIAPMATPPVCRAMDYGKYCYEQNKREKEAKKKQQEIEVKEIRLSCRIDTHDFETKANNAKKFLGDGNKVRVSLRFKGREIAHPEIGKEVMEKFALCCEELGSVDKKIALDGRQMSMLIAPIKK